MQRTAEQTAILLALLFKRANVKRARISERTIRVLSKRRSLRRVFLEEVSRELDDLGLHLIELERGGFGLLPVSALNGAQTILAKNFLSEEQKLLRRQEKLNKQEQTFAEFRDEVAGAEEFDTDEE